MSSFAVGIDLGTSTSEIAIYRDGQAAAIADPETKIPIVPSLVALNNRGEILTGDQAKSFVDLPGRGVREVKRLMGSGSKVVVGDREYDPEEISAMVLKKLKRNVEEALGASVSEIVLSVPANFPLNAREATMRAGQMAGLNIIRLINEPTAAAMAFGIRNLQLEEKIAIFDFGGGTLDITILEMMNGIIDVVCSYGDPQLGGKDFDALLMEHLAAHFQRQHPRASVSARSQGSLRTKIEDVKKRLSTSASVNDFVPGYAIENGHPIDFEFDVTRDEFNRISAPLLDRTRDLIRKTLEKGKLAASGINRVLLVGGTTYIPIVRQLVAEEFGCEGRTDVNPDLAVGLGAAVDAALATGLIPQERGLMKSDVSSFGLGINTVALVGQQLMMIYDPLMQPNTTIPYSVRREFSLLHPDQREVEIHLYQDHEGTAKLPEQAIDTGITGVITDIPPGLYGSPHPLMVDFSYDVNGIARLHASIPGLNKDLEINYRAGAQGAPANTQHAAGTQMTQASPSQQDVELWKKHPRAQEFRSLIQKANQYLETIPPRERAPLSTAMMELKDALTTDNTSQIEKSGNRLIDLIFDIENS